MLDKNNILKRKEYIEIFDALNKKNLSVIYLTISGSHAYGTNNEDSDIDIRGVFLNSMESRIGIKSPIEDYESKVTDTVLYSFHKFCKLLSQVNPNVIEMLGTREEDVLLSSPLSNILRDNAELFLSKRAFITFAGYATQQLRRLENALARDSYPQSEKERHILQSFDAEMLAVQKKFSDFNLCNDIKLYLADSRKEDFDKEIYIDANLHGVPLRDYIILNNDLNNMIKNYEKIRHRNNKKDAAHLNKHAMHLIRLYYTGIDILKEGTIRTYREKEHDILMSIRNGEVPFEKIFELRNKLELELQKARDESKLPDEPSYDKINDFIVKNYLRFCKNEEGKA